jgi:hypothetical protein
LHQVVIIKSSNDAGLGNRLQAMTSAFLFAIVTKRLLLVDWAENKDAIVRNFLIFSAVSFATQQHAPLPRSSILFASYPSLCSSFFAAFVT